jgi:hypothetical protein
MQRTLDRLMPVLRRYAGRALVLTLTLGLLVAAGWRFTGGADASPRYDVPHDGAMESSLGVRFTQAALVADGGIVELRYTVLNTEKASAFQNDVHHPPTLTSERSGKVAYRTALMKQGHELRAGQSYYVLYLNNGNGIKRSDKIAIATGKHKLAHVPVR